ncbi:unnamed protein product [Amoebophrya sp. A120]|nr:unnamed protein product [Amoebophrya sp. A120]|eukprot:GSA120T00000402001.1
MADSSPLTDYTAIFANYTSLRGQLVCTADADCSCGANVEGYCGFKASEGSSFLDYVMVVILICLSGLFSGLTLGLLGLDLAGLEIVINGDDEEQKKYARRIYPVRKHGNLLLCTLLLGNVMVNAALAIFMGDMAGGVMGFIVSSGVIVIFGEIVPQSACSRYALLVGAHTIWVVYVFGFLLFPLAFPIAKALDYVLGEELGTSYSRKELMYLLKVQAQAAHLSSLEEQVLQGALSFKDKKVTDVMTPFPDVFKLPFNTILDYDTVALIWKSGFSRVPIYSLEDEHSIVAILLTRDLMLVDPDDAMPVKDFLQMFARTYVTFYPQHSCGFAINVFKKGTIAHLALVVEEDTRKLLGVFSKEDIFEEILGQEFDDESAALPLEVLEAKEDVAKTLLHGALSMETSSSDEEGGTTVGAAATTGAAAGTSVDNKENNSTSADDIINSGSKRNTKSANNKRKNASQIELQTMSEMTGRHHNSTVSSASGSGIAMKSQASQGDELLEEREQLLELTKMVHEPASKLRGGQHFYNVDPMSMRVFNKALAESPLTPFEIAVLCAHLRENYPGPELFHELAVSKTRMEGSVGREELLSDHDAAGSSRASWTSMLKSRLPWRFQTGHMRQVGEGWIGGKALRWLLATGAQVEVRVKKNSHSALPEQEDFLLQAGKPCDDMIIVLTGVVRIAHHHVFSHGSALPLSQFQQDLGSNAVLNIEALVPRGDTGAEGYQRITPAYSAWISSHEVCIVKISRANYEEAKSLEKAKCLPDLDTAHSHSLAVTEKARKLRTMMMLARKQVEMEHARVKAVEQHHQGDPHQGGAGVLVGSTSAINVNRSPSTSGRGSTFVHLSPVVQFGGAPAVPPGAGSSVTSIQSASGGNMIFGTNKPRKSMFHNEDQPAFIQYPKKTRSNNKTVVIKDVAVMSSSGDAAPAGAFSGPLDFSGTSASSTANPTATAHNHLRGSKMRQSFARLKTQVSGNLETANDGTWQKSSRRVTSKGNASQDNFNSV